MPQPTSPPRLGLDELAAQYGYAASFFFSDAELKRLIEQAVKEQWTPAKFQAKFMATRWYRTKSADVRSWIELQRRDPGESNARIKHKANSIYSQAVQMGITGLTGSRLWNMARDSLMFGWTDVELQNALSAEFKYKPRGGTIGQAATMEDFIRRQASDYGVGVTDRQVGDWLRGALSGRYTEDHLRDFVRSVARSKYPGLTSYLDAGFTVRDVATPYVTSYSQLLEVPEDAVQMTDAKIQKALQGTVPAKGGMPQMQTVYEFERDLRKDPRWRRTKNAREAATNAALGVLQDMGLYS